MPIDEKAAPMPLETAVIRNPLSRNASRKGILKE
jgi:hypothetical protein